MKIKAKHIFIVGAFIVLTIIGYNILPRDEIVINLNSEESSNNLEDKKLSGNIKKEEMIYVHIEGAVNSPGIKVVPKGTRVFEIIELADGELNDADLSKINLASILKDEQKVYVPYKVIVNEEVEKNSTSNTKTQISTSNEQAGSTYDNIELININTAKLEDLQELSGIGPSMAQKILNYREENGYFSSIEEIKNVSGIGEAKYNKIKDNITI